MYRRGVPRCCLALLAVMAACGDNARAPGAVVWTRLDGPGEKYIEPAVIDQRVYVTSCDSIADGATHLEVWDLGRPETE
jgi:hypothetical protein